MKQIIYALGFVVVMYFAWRYMRKIRDDVPRDGEEGDGEVLEESTDEKTITDENSNNQRT
ncbi:MAG: hypothetical protein LBS54_08340 [Dysgonamonadaceae bacterium]|jgi:hypothetical protein|nr:hypothetical protein [Dysgonamonadaceae bacterium]